VNLNEIAATPSTSTTWTTPEGASRKVMVIGAGTLGSLVYRHLAGLPGLSAQLVGHDSETTRRISNSVRFESIQLGLDGRFSCAQTDVRDVSRTAAVISAFDPDVIFLAVSYQSWWVISELPQLAFQTLYAANYGPWLPMHLAPVRRCMQAIRMAGSNAIVVNAAYPDAVHPALNAEGLSPDLGIGNVANNVPALRHGAAAELGLPVAEVEVRLVGHHYISHFMSRATEIPDDSFVLRILASGEDVTCDFPVQELLRSLSGPHRRVGGIAGTTMTAASAMSILKPVILGTTAVAHGPGPWGFAGGYPLTITPSGAKLRLPPGLDLATAIAVNRRGQERDGIEEIDACGRVRITEHSAEIFQRELGHTCRQYSLDEVDLVADDILRRFGTYRTRSLATAAS
jgi:hypothetical protein